MWKVTQQKQANWKQGKAERAWDQLSWLLFSAYLLKASVFKT